MKRWFFFIQLAVVCALSLSCAGADELVYRSPSGVTFHISAAGLSSIQLGDREIATGGWTALNGESWFKDAGTGAVKVSHETQTLTVIDDHHARVRHSGGDVVCTFDYQ